MEKIIHPPALPGCCYFCRSTNREWYIDSKQDIDYYGAVYVCCECITEMARVGGFILPVEARNLAEQAARVEQENVQLRAEISGLEQAVDGLRIARASSGTGSVHSSDLSANATEQTARSERTNVGEGTGTFVEPVHDKGVAELSNDDDANSSDFSIF